MFGLHPNAEIGYLTTQSETLFSTILSVSGGGAGGAGDNSKVKTIIANFREQLPAQFNMFEVKGKVKEATPYVVVCLQESERMNTLLGEIGSSLTDLDAGLRGALNITDAMETLSSQLSLNIVPTFWEKNAYASKKPLLDWYADMRERHAQLVRWSEDLVTPSVVWISALFNPMSYITAISQVTARAAGLPLDGMALVTTVTNSKDIAEFPEFAEDGAYIHGFFLEGAGWENGRGGEEGYLTDM